jgi:hypothetical protein
LFGLVVLADLAIFLHLFDGFIAVSTRIAHGDASIFRDLFEPFDDIFTLVFREGLEGQADYVAVILRVDSDICGQDGFFDIGQSGLIPGLDDDGTRFGDGDIAKLFDWCGLTIVVDFDII